MRELAILGVGMLIGNWGPPLLVWLLTRHERAERRVRRAQLDELLEDVRLRPHADPEQLRIPRQSGRTAAPRPDA